MMQALNAFVKYFQSPSNGLKDMSGVDGPFWGEAPERSVFPYITFNTTPLPLVQGFTGVSEDCYGEVFTVTLNLYDTDPVRVGQNVEKLMAKIDLVSPTDIGCNSILRKLPPQPITEPVKAGESKRVYRIVVPYEFRVSRTKGIA